MVTKDYKMVDKYLGYVGENCYKAEGRRFIKRLIRRHNRHKLNQQIKRK